MIDIFITGCLLALICSFTIRSIVKTFNVIQEFRIRSFETKKQRFKL